MSFASALIWQILVLVGKLPMRVRVAVGRFAGGFYGSLPSRERRIATAQLTQFLGPTSASQGTLRGIFASVGVTLMESLNLNPYLNQSTLHIECSERERIRALAASNSGALFLSAHTSNWDLLAAWGISEFGLKIFPIGRPARSALLHRLLLKLRSAYGAETIWRNDRGGARELLRVLRSGGCLAALIDQDTRVKGVFAPFFGRAALTPVSLVELAVREQTPIFAAFAFRTAPLHYRVFIKELDKQLPPAQILTAYNLELERLIRQFPEQWVWFHKRWRSLPDGRTLGTSEYLSYLENQEDAA
ncbi:MAG: lysophospholipid acyltransferase family protein [Oligoflexia bacterium]|nr:lysophospholipid acyltransferase family protein [Oligoflexia bacterium]